MVKSMTGYGRGEYNCRRYNIDIELKAINHRYNDIVVHMPRYMYFLEEDIKNLVKKDIKRGRVDIYVNIEYTDEASFDIDVNLPLAREYKQALESIVEGLEIDSSIDLKDIIGGPDIISIQRESLEDDELWMALKAALELAIEEAVEMKKIEGLNLKKDMLDRLNKIEEKIHALEKRVPLVVKEYKNKLESRIEELLSESKNSSVNVDKYILANEVANFADKSDISEELTRLISHIEQYRNILSEENLIGRKLDFLIQEINREINTIGSKSGDIQIVKEVVYIKSEIEKLREQVQNIE